jgi:branched-chain amino acid aminotransferase
MPKLQKSLVYLRDQFVPFEDANISIASSPVLYGLSIYTVFGVHWNEKKNNLYMFRLRDHYDRLINSAKIIDFHQFIETWTYEKFEKTMKELLIKNNIQKDSLVRVSVFIDETLAGTKIHGLTNSLSAFVYPLNQLYDSNGINMCVSSWQRTPDNAIPSRAKLNGSYINAALMKNEALLNGYDDAISVDSHGHVAESTVANLFLVRNNVLITPDGATDLLEGITRDSIFSLADSLGIQHKRRSVDRSELYLADEAFLCGSSANITPVISIDKRPVGTGKAGPATSKLAREYAIAQKGEHKEFNLWLTGVY